MKKQTQSLSKHSLKLAGSVSHARKKINQIINQLSTNR
jgi:hypothetical protein